MKKFKNIILLALFVFFSKNIYSADFTLAGYQFGTEPVLALEQVEKNNGVNLVSKHIQNEKISNKINSAIDKIVNKIPNNEKTKYAVFTLANNSKFFSVVIVKETIENEQSTFHHTGLVFDVATGEKLELDDILAPGYQDSMKNLLNDRIAGFGINKTKSFNGMNDVSSFYMEEDSLVLIFDKGVATNDNDGIVFIPFFLITLQQILK